LLSILLSEGSDVYGVDINKDDMWLPKMLLDDIQVVYLAAVSTTQISVNNIMKYVHMDQYRPVLEKLRTEIDEHLAF